MDSWLTYTDYQERCPDTTLTEAEFRQLAAKAALEIEGATHWRAVLAALPEETVSWPSVRRSWLP